MLQKKLRKQILEIISKSSDKITESAKKKLLLSADKSSVISQGSEFDDDIFLTAFDWTTKLKEFQAKIEAKREVTKFYIEDKSSNGTYLNGKLIGKGNIQEICSNNVISFVDSEENTKESSIIDQEKSENHFLSHIVQYLFIVHS